MVAAGQDGTGSTVVFLTDFIGASAEADRIHGAGKGEAGGPNAIAFQSRPRTHPVTVGRHL